jgi:protein SCO1
MRALRVVRRSAFVGIGLVVAAATLWLLVGDFGKPPPAAAIGGPIRLTDQSGAPFDSASLAGKPYAVFFGFTHCPEVCPTTLYELSTDLKQLGDAAKELRVLFVTVDPERDTPEFLENYLANFDPRIMGLTGTADEIAAVAKSFRVFYEKVATGEGDYTMNHTALVYLMDRHGQFFGTLAYDESGETKLQKLRRLLKEG